MRNARGRIAIHGSAAVGLLLVAGCGGIGETTEESSVSATRMHLTIDVGAASGVTGIHYEIVPVSCIDGTPLEGATPIVTDKSLSSMGVPGAVPELEGNPLDKGSSHAFADDFVTVPAGCYNVTTTPLSDTLTCYSAHQDGVVVEEGRTTEVFLVNQCTGEDTGAIDTLSAVNHPPTILDVSFQNSKFVGTCGQQVICATATDSDLDPIDFVFAKKSGPDVVGPSVESQVKNADGSTTQCVAYIPQAAGIVEMSVSVYDVLHEAGAFQRIEDWLAAHGDAHSSHATLEFPFYALEDRLPIPEVCGDGIDDDCNGVVDDPSACAPVSPTGCPEGLAPVCTGTIDLMILQDLSGSFLDDLVKVRSLAPTLAAQLNAASADVEFGLAAFVDKPFSPFGGTGDYVFQMFQPLTSDSGAFIAAVDAMTCKWGDDTSEAQIEALGLLANNSSAVGFRTGAKHFVVLATDAPYHQAGDCTTAVGGCTSANNGDGVADLDEDYPSLEQVIAELNTADITPIFAVAGGSYVEAPYEALVTQLGRGSVMPLASDSSNLVNTIFAGMGTSCTCR